MSPQTSLLGISVIAALSLSACDATPAAKTTATTTIEGPAAPAQVAPLTATGAPVALTPEAASESDNGLQWAASVVDLDPIPDQDVKLFGTAGGDPAMNGLYTYLAFYLTAGDGWAVYKIGDVLDYAVLSSSLGRVDLDLHESKIDEATGIIGSRHRKVILQWTPGEDGVPPTSVTVTPAE